MLEVQPDVGSELQLKVQPEKQPEVVPEVEMGALLEVTGRQETGSATGSRIRNTTGRATRSSAGSAPRSACSTESATEEVPEE